MANAGTIPSYQFKPTNTENPHMRTSSHIRSRLFNNTYFRATEPGRFGNQISLGIVQIGEYGQGKPTPTGKLYITNHVNQSGESIVISNTSSKLKTKYFDITGLGFNETITVIVVSPSQIKITNTISLQIRKFSEPEIQVTDYGVKPMGMAFTIKDGVTLCIDSDKSVLSVGDIITIKPRIEVYDLEWDDVTVTSPDGEGGASTEVFHGWNIDKLRELVNDNSKWVQMLPRAFDKPDANGSGTEKPRNPGTDIQDTGFDFWVLYTFPDTYLANGDGLPSTPDNESTGPCRSLIHINYGELYLGNMGEVNKIYEWNGASNLEGTWVSLF